MKTNKLRCFLLAALTTILLPSSKVFAQVVPTVSIVSVSPKSITGAPWIDATVTYSTNEPGENLKFYVDYVLEGSVTSSMGFGQWTTTTPLYTAGTHVITIQAPGNSATTNYVVSPYFYPSWTDQQISLTALNTYTATQTYTMPANSYWGGVTWVNLTTPGNIQFLVNGMPVPAQLQTSNRWGLSYQFYPGQTYTVTLVVTANAGAMPPSTAGTWSGLFDPVPVNSN